MTVEPDVERSATALGTIPSSDSSRRSIAGHLWHLSIILIAVVAMFWRVFFLGETLVDVNTLNNQLPWGYSAGQSDYPYNRRDLTDTYVTREYFVASAYHDREFPLWNPYTMAGHPIYADGVTRTLSPFLLFYKFFDVPLGYSLARLSELMLAAVFMYFFLTMIGTSAKGALVGTLVFVFSAHSMLHLTGLGWWGGLMWLPLILLFVDRAIRRESYLQAMLAGVFLAAQFFCGYLPNQIYYVGAVVLYYVFFAVASGRGSSGKPRIASLAPLRVPLVLMAITLAVGLALSATQWVPSLELLSYSNRKIVGAELGYVYLPPWYAATLVFPNLFGAAYDAKALTLFTALGVSHDHILYLGVAALVPLGFCLFWLRKTGKNEFKDSQLHLPKLSDTARRRLRFFVLLGTCSLVMMMAAPLYVHVTRFIPILQVIRVAVRAGVLFLFASVVLVAHGTDLILQSVSEALRQFARLARTFAIWVVAFAVIAIISSYLIRSMKIAVEATERGRWAFIRRAALTLSTQFTPPNPSILIPLALLIGVLVLLWTFVEKRLTGRGFLYGMVALLLVDLFWTSNQFDHTFDRSRVFPPTEITDLLHSLPPGRVLIVPSGLETNRSALAGAEAEKIIAPPNTMLPYRIPVVSGKNQQFPRWYREFASLIEPQPNLSHVVFDRSSSPFFDLLNVRYVLTNDSAPPLSGFGLLGTADGVSVYENKNAMPRTFFANKVLAVNGSSESLAAMMATAFDPRTQTVVETADPAQRLMFESRPPPALQSPELQSSTAAVIADGRNWVRIETDNLNDGLLVLSDNYYPGWSASVDGLPAQIFRANHTMRAVNLPAGKHLVSFVFAPAAFFVSLYVSLAAGALTIAALIPAVIRRRRKSYDIR